MMLNIFQQFIMDNSVFLSIGTNIGDKIKNLNLLLKNINNKSINILKISSVYNSEPFESNCKNNFYNIVIKVQTHYSLLDFFNITQIIEEDMGRKIKNNPDIERIIDIDILAYENVVFSNKNLIIPHAEIHKRKFVLLPWSEISSDYIIPKYNKTVKFLLNNVKDSSKVCKLDYRL